MHLFIEILAALAFVASSGLFLNEKLRRNYAAIGIAGLIAVLSSYLTLKEAMGWFTKPHGSSVANRPLILYGDESRSPPFTAEVLHWLVELSFAHGCQSECNHICYNNDCNSVTFSMIRIPPNDKRVGKRAYLVTAEKSEYCGSGGCPNILLLINDDENFSIITEGNGISDRQAVLIVREAYP